MNRIWDARHETPDTTKVIRVSRLASRVSILVAIVSFCGCVSRPTAVVSRSPADLHDWQANGRIAVSSGAAGGSGPFIWSQRGDETRVRMHGPVGIGHLELTLANDSLRIDTPDGRHYADEDALRDLAERLGARVPVQDLRYWLIGVAAPGEHRWMNADDSATLLQHEWRIDYQHFATTAGVRLPTKFVATSGPAKVRIVVDRWTVK